MWRQVLREPVLPFSSHGQTDLGAIETDIRRALAGEASQRFASIGVWRCRTRLRPSPTGSQRKGRLWALICGHMVASGCGNRLNGGCLLECRPWRRARGLRSVLRRSGGDSHSEGPSFALDGPRSGIGAGLQVPWLADDSHRPNDGLLLSQRPDPPRRVRNARARAQP
jgi:hypothetical protein